MPETIIDIRNVSKRFSLSQQRGERTLKGAVLEALGRRARRREFWALQDVTLQVERGQTVGLIGSNGAGKSTLLSLISRTSEPTTGTIRTEGRVSSLLELGAGFHPDLSGRENVYLYGAIMGLSRERMRARFDRIVEFAGLAEWIDEPVKHYSSGMYVRLGFAVAVEVDPDVLIIDEVLAVGDAAFQRKSLARIREFRERGKTLLVVSHDLGTIHTISDKLVLLDRGRVVAAGEPDRVVADYQWLSRSRDKTAGEKEWGTGEVRIESAEFLDAAGRPAQEFRRGGPLTVRLRYRARHRIEDPVFGFSISTASGVHVYGNNTQIEQFRIPAIEGEGSLCLEFPCLELLAGAYLFSFSTHSADHKTNYHRLDNSFAVTVTSDRRYEGVCHLPVQWRTGA